MILGLGEGEGPWASGYVQPSAPAALTPPVTPLVSDAFLATIPLLLGKKTSSTAPAKPSSIPWASIAKWGLLGAGVVGAVVLLSAKSEREQHDNPCDDDDEDSDDEDDDDEPDDNPRAAMDFYRKFHWGREPRKIGRAKLAPRPRELVKLGVLEAVTYSAKKGGEKLADYIHHFGEEGHKKPLLTADPRTRKLHIVGGDYGVEAAGIVR